MEIEQTYCMPASAWIPHAPGQLGDTAQLVFLFGSIITLRLEQRLAEVRQAYPHAILLGCSTAGEIYDTQVLDDSLVVTAVHFAHTRVVGSAVSLADATNSYAAGRQLAETFDPLGLVHVFVLSEGLHINGSDLVSGLTQTLPRHVTVTGGLSADGARFAETLVHWNGESAPGSVAAIGLYGDHLRVGFGSLGGWDSFGPDRLITRSNGNVLYELDGTSALELYKRYLGEHADHLPASGLLFPLSVASHPTRSAWYEPSSLSTSTREASPLLVTYQRVLTHS